MLSLKCKYRNFMEIKNMILSPTPTTHFVICSASIFLFYLTYGYILELIFTLEGMKNHGWFLTWIQFGFYSFFAFFQVLFTSQLKARRIPFETYLMIAALTVGTMGFSNTSMGYLNYPTQVIFKSCKLIPVMIGSILILGKQYSLAQVVACVCMCAGLVWFTLADSTVQPSFDVKGVVLVCLALFCDAVIGNVQEGAMKEHNESPTLVVLYSYSIGFLIILITLVGSKSLVPALQFSFLHPTEVYGRALLLSFAGYCGVQVVLNLVKSFGALLAVTVTTFRKALSIALSFVFFAKPFTIHYLWGGLLVALGVYLNVKAQKSSSLQLSTTNITSFFKTILYFFRPAKSARTSPLYTKLIDV